jgi:hypothetical protein
MRFGFILLVLVFFISCRSLPESDEEPIEVVKEREVTSASEIPLWAFDSSPIGNHPVFVVFSGRRTSREDEREAALMAAAEEAVRYEGLYVSAKELVQEGNTTMGYAADVRVEFPKERAVEFLDSLEMDRIVYSSYGTIARYIYTAKTIALEGSTLGNPPNWIVSPPVLKGYVFAVGTTQRYNTWQKSFLAADKKAIAQISYSLYGNVDDQSDRLDWGSADGDNTYSLETVYMRGEGIITNLLILARWVDPEEKLF